MTLKKLRLALGDKPDWVMRWSAKLGDTYDLAQDRFHADHALWADVVIPLTLNDYGVMRGNPPFKSKGLFPSITAVEICNDKQHFRDWFSARFDPVYLPGQTGTTTCSIAKRRHGAWGVGAYLIDTNNQEAMDAVRADKTMLLEDYVAGHREYAYHLLFDQGRILFAGRAAYEHDQAYYIQGKDCRTSASEVIRVNNPPQIFADLLGALDYSGTVCIDCKPDENGQIKILEVNPRVGFSLIHLVKPYAAAYCDYVCARHDSDAAHGSSHTTRPRLP